MKVCIHCCIEFEEGGEYYCSEKCKQHIRKKIQWHNKRAKKYNAGKISAQDWIFILEKNNFSCEHCGRKNGKIEMERLSIDHRIPLSENGKNILTNLSCLCVKCHKRKDRETCRNQGFK